MDEYARKNLTLRYPRIGEMVVDLLERVEKLERNVTEPVVISGDAVEPEKRRRGRPKRVIS